MGMREKLLTGELYACDDDSVAAKQATWLEKVYEYNLTRPSEPEKRKAMLTLRLKQSPILTATPLQAKTMKLQQLKMAVKKRTPQQLQQTIRLMQTALLQTAVQPN